jgi:vancomycin resistance protein YoaR
VVEPARRRSRIVGRIRRITWRGWFSIAAITFVVLVVGAWAIDTATLHHRVPRNVTVAGVDIGRRGAGSSDQAIDRAAEAYSHTRIELVIKGKVTTLRAADVGLHLDPAATLAAAMAVGRHDNPLARPVLWAASFFRPRRAPVRTSVDTTRLTFALAALPGQVPVHEPTVVGSPYGVGISAGQSGRGFAASEVATQLEQAATLGKLPIRVNLTARFIQPTHTDAEALLLAAEAARLTARPINLVTGDATVSAGPALLRTWITSVPGAHGLVLAMPGTDAQTAAEQLLGRVQHQPVDASFTVTNGAVRLIPQRNGTRCCAPDTGAAVLKALQAGKSSVSVPLIQIPPPFTTAKARALRIATRIGTVTNFDGIREDRGYTVSYNGNVATNVAATAAMLRGRVLLPHQILSLNQLLGPPTPENGFYAAPIDTPDGPTLVSGGGQDIVASALFNAAFFGGLDIVSSTAHGIQVPGLPPGREANLGWSQPDLLIRNNSPYGVLIWTQVTGGTVTVQLFSTPYAIARQSKQTIKQTGPQNRCTHITTERTRVFPSGRQLVDVFRAVYAPTPNSRTDPLRTAC